MILAADYSLGNCYLHLFQGQNQSGGGPNGPGDGKKGDKNKEKKKYERPLPTRVGKRKKKSKGPDAANKLPSGRLKQIVRIWNKGWKVSN